MPDEFILNQKALWNNRNSLYCSNQTCGEKLHLGDLVIKTRSNTHGLNSRTKYYHAGCFYSEPKVVVSKTGKEDVGMTYLALDFPKIILGECDEAEDEATPI